MAKINMASYSELQTAVAKLIDKNEAQAKLIGEFKHALNHFVEGTNCAIACPYERGYSESDQGCRGHDIDCPRIDAARATLTRAKELGHE